MANMSETSYIHGFFFPRRIVRTYAESVLLTDSKFKEHWKKRYDFFLKKIAFKYNSEQLLLKSPCNTARVEAILELYPDAKFIHIYRNPYDVYRSTERLYEKILPIASFQKVSNAEMEKYIMHAYESMHRQYLEKRKDIPKNQLFEMRYEDFVKEPKQHLEKAYQHLGLDRFSAVEDELMKEIKREVDYKKNTYSDIPKAIKEEINTRWKFAIEAFGYAVED